jgi:hypothetical protein
VRPLAAAWEERSDPGALRALNPLVVFDTVPQFIRWIETTVEPRTAGPKDSHASRHGAGV